MAGTGGRTKFRVLQEDIISVILFNKGEKFYGGHDDFPVWFRFVAKVFFLPLEID